METVPIIEVPDNAYYKDINNVLNDFEGTWLYTNDTISLKISLIKSVQYFNGDYYEDTMVGGYQYIENGVEIVNTLTDADNPSLGYEASIEGNTIHQGCRFLPVNDCTDEEKSLGLYIDTPDSDKHWGNLRVFKRNISGQTAIKINIEMTYVTGADPLEGDLPDPSIPWQMHDIVLIKQ